MKEVTLREVMSSGLLSPGCVVWMDDREHKLLGFACVSCLAQEGYGRYLDLPVLYFDWGRDSGKMHVVLSFDKESEAAHDAE